MQHFWESAHIVSIVDILRAKLFGAPPASHPRSLQVTTDPSPGPDTPPLELARTPRQLAEYTKFVSTHFLTAGSDGPRSSLTVNTLETLVKAGARPLLYRQEATATDPGNLLGCILSLPLGKLYRGGVRGHAPFTLRLIRDFCVATQKRGDGIGSKLLLGVFKDCMENGGGVHTLFLKEGAPLPRAGATLRTSSWIWRRVGPEVGDRRWVREVPLAEAAELVSIFGLSRPRLLYNRPAAATAATRVFLYDGFRGAILAAFTPAYQVHPRDGMPIIFQTGWLESGELLPMERITALRQLTDMAAAEMAAPWVWMDRTCSGSTLPAPWQSDGPFHWYGYGWTADLYGDAEIFLFI